MNGVLIPQKVFVGDHAQFLISLEKFTIPQGLFFVIDDEYHIILDNFIQHSDISIEQIIIKKTEKNFSMNLHFIPWKTGTINFPSLEYFGIKNKLPAITVQSVLKKTGRADIAPPHQPLLLPGTISLILESVSIIFFSGIVILLIGHKIIKKRHSPYHKKKQVKNRRHFLRLLKKLLRKHNKMHTDEWCTQLDMALRIYLINFFEKDNINNNTLSLTYTEIYKKLAPMLNHKKHLLSEFTTMFKTIQRVRFSANSTLSADQKKEMIAFAQKLSTTCEQHAYYEMEKIT